VSDLLSTHYGAQMRAMLMALDYCPRGAREIATKAGLPRSVFQQRISGILRRLVGAGLAETARIPSARHGSRLLPLECCRDGA
jgi:hypothetical protein